LTTCSVRDCEFDAYNDEGKCTLHCEKSDYAVDFRKQGLLHQFYRELIDYIVKETFKVEDESPVFNPEAFREYLEVGEMGLTQDIAEQAKKTFTVMQDIVFPDRKGRDYFDYIKVLKNLGNIHFDNCEFNLTELNLGDVNCSYQVIKGVGVI